MTVVRAKKWLAGVMVTSFALLGMSLVAYDILRRFEWFVPSIVAQEADAPQRDEIRKYVQFTEVRYRSFGVTTGVERASDKDRQITSQWCYIAGSAGQGRNVQLTLATKGSTDALSIARPTQTALSDFNLSQQRLRRLITSHCRFQ